MRRIVVFALALVLSVVPAFRSEAQTGGSARPDPETPALFKADRVRHDRDLGLVIATGNVVVTHGARILLADTLIDVGDQTCRN